MPPARFYHDAIERIPTELGRVLGDEPAGDPLEAWRVLGDQPAGSPRQAAISCDCVSLLQISDTVCVHATV